MVGIRLSSKSMHTSGVFLIVFQSCTRRNSLQSVPLFGSNPRSAPVRRVRARLTSMMHSATMVHRASRQMFHVKSMNSKPTADDERIALTGKRQTSHKVHGITTLLCQKLSWYDHSLVSETVMVLPLSRVRNCHGIRLPLPCVITNIWCSDRTLFLVTLINLK